MHTIEFQYYTGLKQQLFANARLMGSWDENGRHSQAWSTQAMSPIVGEDGCLAFNVRVDFDSADQGKNV